MDKDGVAMTIIRQLQNDANGYYINAHILKIKQKEYDWIPLLLL